MFLPTKPTYNSKEKFYEELSEDTIVGAHCVGARREFMRFLQKYNAYTPPCAVLPLWSIFLSIVQETPLASHLFELGHFELVNINFKKFLIDTKKYLDE